MEKNASVKTLTSRGRVVISNSFTKQLDINKPITVIREAENSIRLTQHKKRSNKDILSAVKANPNTGTCQVCVSNYFNSNSNTVVVYNDLTAEKDIIVKML